MDRWSLLVTCSWGQARRLRVFEENAITERPLFFVIDLRECSMQLSNPFKTLLSALVALAAMYMGSSLGPAQTQSNAAAEAKSQACPNDDSGLKLPAGFCAAVFADEIGHARHMVAGPSGVLYVNTWSGRYYGKDTPHAGGFLVALQDKSGAGKADVMERFGETVQSGGAGGTGIGMYKGAIYAEINDRIVRYSLPAGSTVPSGSADTIVSRLPLGGDHPMHPFIINAEGLMYVDVASATNSCQLKNRTLKSPGANPCTELETRGGIWRYDANKTNEATLPAEELLLLKPKGDYGWPECYYDPFVEKLVLAPEYGGDGKTIGVCANKIAPTAAFPAHWAPNAMVRYDQKQFPARYREGVFIAFHGSWNRAPYAQGGYNVVFQALAGDRASGQCEIFADGFAGAVKSPAKAAHRPSGLAVGPDGSLYVSDDIRGRIYRIVYRGGSEGGSEGGAASVTACPSATAPAGNPVEVTAEPPEGTHPDAGAAAVGSLPVPEGATREMVALGERIYRGQAGGAACTGCHGESGEGTPLGPDLTGKKWLWSDGSYAGIAKTITEGVSQPKQYRSPMPPMGGAQLTPDQVSALVAYVWGLSHRASPNRN